MKLYKLIGTKHVSDDISVHMHQWVGSQAAAATTRGTWVKAGMRQNDITTLEVDVPTDKKGLIDFLNESQVN